MPQNLSIAVFVLGAVLLLLSLVSGGFKIFGSEIPGAASRVARAMAFVIGLFLIGFALWRFNDVREDARKPESTPAVVSSNPAPTPAPAPALSDQPAQSKPAPPADRLTDARARQTFGEEGVDFGIEPRNSIQPAVASETPTSIPGARVITTGELKNAIDEGRNFLLVDVLTDLQHFTLPSAKRVPNMGLPQPNMDIPEVLEQMTGGNKGAPMVFYCQGARCWESYNAALRAKNAGYTNVYWYRGGLAAWMAAGYLNN